MGAVYDVGDYVGALDAVLERAGYDDLRAEQRRRRERGDPVQMGIGVSCYVEITGKSVTEGDPQEVARIRIHDDGAATVFTGTSPHGQGHDTSWSMIASSELGIPMDRIDGGARRHRPRARRRGHVRVALAAAGRRGGAAGQHRGGRPGPVARRRAARGRRRRRRARQGDRRVPRRAGRPTVAKSWGELASREQRARPRRARRRVELRRARPDVPVRRAPRGGARSTWRPARSSSCAIVACDDAGTVLNPLIFEGQVHGGIAQGAAQALVEEFAYDADGNPVTGELRRLHVHLRGRAPRLRDRAPGDADARTTRSAPRGSVSRAPSARRPRCSRR